MKSIVYIILVTLGVTACAQQNNNEQQKEKTQTTMDIKAILDDDPYIGKLQKYDYEPEYVIQVETLYSYEIRINDMPVATNFSTIGGTIWYPINEAILNSGEQTLSIHIYPRYTDDETQKEYFEDPESYNFRLWIEQSAWIKGSKEEPKIVLQYKLPKIDDNGTEVDYTQLQSHHDELKFNATVPYELKGWSESKVFNKKDSLQLEKKVAIFYQKYRQLMVDKRALELQKIKLNQAYETAQYTYLDKEKLFNDRKEYVKNFPNERFIMAKLENYELKFYGNNRVLGLVFTEDPDKGESAIAKKYLDKNGNGKISYYSVLLHQAKGTDSLEIIR